MLETWSRMSRVFQTKYNTLGYGDRISGVL